MANEFYVQLERHRMHIQRLYGAYDFQDGMMNSQPQTRGGTMAMYEAGMDRTISKLQLIEEALNDLGTVIGEMIPYVYDTRKVIRIISPNNETKEIVFNQQQADKIVNDLTSNKFDFYVVSRSTLPSNRAFKHEELLRMWELGVMKNPTPILRTTDLPNIDQIIEDEDRLNQATQIIQQLQDNVKQLEGDMQTKDRELDTANMQVSKAKFDSALKGIEAQLQAWLQLGKSRINDQVKSTINALSKGATETTSQDKAKG
jgi:hypothetical protein